jgi:hypothetical protein
MPEWKNVKVRGDLHRMVAQRALADRRSISQMTDVLLTGALEREPGLPTDAPSPEGRSDRAGSATPVPARAPVQRIQGQATVDEMLASCPQCAGELEEVGTLDERGISTGKMTVRCVDCGWVREPGADGHGR